MGQWGREPVKGTDPPHRPGQEQGREEDSQTGIEAEEVALPQRDDVQEKLQDLLQRTAPVKMISGMGSRKKEQVSMKNVSGKVTDMETVSKKQIPQTDFEQIIREECERERRPSAKEMPKKKKLYSSAKPPEDF